MAILLGFWKIITHFKNRLHEKSLNAGEKKLFSRFK